MQLNTLSLNAYHLCHSYKKQGNVVSVERLGGENDGHIHVTIVCVPSQYQPIGSGINWQFVQSRRKHITKENAEVGARFFALFLLHGTLKQLYDVAARCCEDVLKPCGSSIIPLKKTRKKTCIESTLLPLTNLAKQNGICRSTFR